MIGRLLRGALLVVLAVVMAGFGLCALSGTVSTVTGLVAGQWLWALMVAGLSLVGAAIARACWRAMQALRRRTD